MIPKYFSDKNTLFTKVPLTWVHFLVSVQLSVFRFQGLVVRMGKALGELLYQSYNKVNGIEKPFDDFGNNSHTSLGNQYAILLRFTLYLSLIRVCHKNKQAV